MGILLSSLAARQGNLSANHGRLRRNHGVGKTTFGHQEWPDPVFLFKSAKREHSGGPSENRRS